MRKKAKYLHDAPPEALMPGVGGYRNNSSESRQSPLAGSVPMPETPATQQQAYGQQPSASAYPVFQPQVGSESQGHMPPPVAPGSVMASFGNQQGQVQGQFNSGAPQDSPSHQSLPENLQQASASESQQFNNGPMFDPSDPALFNFDLASLNFGNHYGALEFGMLGHMATGAGETPPAIS